MWVAQPSSNCPTAAAPRARRPASTPRRRASAALPRPDRVTTSSSMRASRSSVWRRQEFWSGRQGSVHLQDRFQIPRRGARDQITGIVLAGSGTEWPTSIRGRHRLQCWLARLDNRPLHHLGHRFRVDHHPHAERRILHRDRHDHADDLPVRRLHAGRRPLFPFRSSVQMGRSGFRHHLRYRQLGLRSRDERLQGLRPLHPRLAAGPQPIGARSSRNS